jgi:hypothetical protein
VPHSLAATPNTFPIFNPGPSDAVNDRLLITPAAGTPTPPAYVADGSKDGRTYELTGPHVSNGTGGDCNASGFHGAAYSTQPTPFVQDTTSTTAVMWGATGSSPPNITHQVAVSGGCQSGSPPQVEGNPGCVMLLPIASSGSGAGTPKVLDVGAWGAFYVWCLRSTGAGCQVYAGQFLADWPISGGPATNTWRCRRGIPASSCTRASSTHRW